MTMLQQTRQYIAIKEEQDSLNLIASEDNFTDPLQLDPLQLGYN